MNYIGHLLITYPMKGLSVGNLLGDMVRNKHLAALNPLHRSGVIIHRYIDSSTDSHPAVRALHAGIRESQGKYAPVAIDVLLDHAICAVWDNLMDISFTEFEHWAYTAIDSSLEDLPGEAVSRLSRMVNYRWLSAYASAAGMNSVLANMDKRASFESNFSSAMLAYQQYEQVFQDVAASLIPEIRLGMRNEFADVLSFEMD